MLRLYQSLVDCFDYSPWKCWWFLISINFPPLLSCPMVSHGGQDQGRLVSGSTVGPVFVHFVGIEVAFYCHSRHNVIEKNVFWGQKYTYIYIYSIVLMYIPFWCYLQFIIWSSNKKRFSHCRDRTWRCFSSLTRTAFGPPGEPSVHLIFVNFLALRKPTMGEHVMVLGSVVLPPVACYSVIGHSANCISIPFIYYLEYSIKYIA